MKNDFEKSDLEVYTVFDVRSSNVQFDEKHLGYEDSKFHLSYRKTLYSRRTTYLHERSKLANSSLTLAIKSTRYDTPSAA